MKLRRLLTLFCAVVLMSFAACSDDEAGIKEQLSFEDETISLKDANVYLTHKGTYEDRLRKRYVVTDGTFDTETREYTGATYNIEIYLYSADGADSHSTGEYRQLFNVNDAPGSAKVSFIRATSETDELEFRLETREAQESEPLRVSGRFDDGDTITFKFSGDLDSSYLDESEGTIFERVSASLSVRGKIKDISSSFVPV